VGDDDDDADVRPSLSRDHSADLSWNLTDRTVLADVVVRRLRDVERILVRYLDCNVIVKPDSGPDSLPAATWTRGRVELMRVDRVCCWRG